MEEKAVHIAPPLTDERLEKNEEYQRRLREKYSSGFQTSGRDADMARAAILLQENAQIINSYQLQLTKKGVKKRPILKVLKRLYAENADAHASLGRFDIAASIHPDKFKRKEYRSKARAIAMPDDKWCKHPRYIKVDGVRVANYMREADTHSEKHGRVIAILRCNECGFRNATHLPDDLARASQTRAEAISLTKGMSQEEATNVLRAKGFMTERKRL